MLAVAAAFLSLAGAKAVILKHERYDYSWPIDVEVSATDCRRHSPREVACIARTRIEEADDGRLISSIAVHDVVRLRRGRPRFEQGRESTFVSR